MVEKMVDIIQLNKKYVLDSTLNIAFSHGDHISIIIGKLKSIDT